MDAVTGTSHHLTVFWVLIRNLNQEMKDEKEKKRSLSENTFEKIYILPYSNYIYIEDMSKEERIRGVTSG